MLRFGTDGIRGDAATELSTDLVTSLGRAVARALGASRILIGCDTRASGARIEAELTRGITSEPCDAVVLGVAPTPAIAFAAASTGQPALVVSASHNPWTDNGVKVIGADGRKLPDAAEAAIERELQSAIATPIVSPAIGKQVVEDRSDAYEQHLLAALEGRTLAGMRVVLDCANGAASAIGPQVFRDAGADVVAMHDAPDGRNINADCGSTHPESLQHAVLEHRAALGLALDGDADRVLAVDERGVLVDGDQLMTMTALDMRERGALRNNAIAVTVMSNLGLRRALDERGIGVVETSVGDRHVVAAMESHDLALGGEQSGHIVYAQYATTGDGLLTGLLVCDLVQRSGRSMSALAAQMERWPQLNANVRVGGRVDLADATEVSACVQAVEAELGDAGRVLVRASGTEPLVRIMVEAHSQSVAEKALDRLRTVVEAEFGSQTGP